MLKIKRHRSKDEAYILTVRSKGERILYAFIFVIFGIYALSLIYPFVWLVTNSFKNYTDYALDMAQGHAFALPTKLEWGNYAYALSKMQYNGTTFLGMTFNSIWMCVLSLLLNLMVTSGVAYVVARFKFMGRNVIYGVLIFVMTIPIIGTSGSMFKLVGDLHIYNTPIYVIVTSLGVGGMGFLILYAFYQNLPYGYAEAVYIDGGGEGTVYFKIMLPQALPILLTLGVTSFIGKWNDYMTPLLYMPSFPTIASGMYTIKNTLIRSGRDTIYFAGITLSIIPSIILFCAFSDTIMKNMTVGGLKG